MPKFLILDTFNFLHRAYHALPLSFRGTNGEPINAVYGVTSMVISALQQVNTSYIVAALDSIEPTFRVEDFTGYKAHRKPMEDSLASQIPKVLEILEAFDIKQVQAPGYEADDIIGTIVHKFSGVEYTVISNDRDLWQLISDSVRIALPNKVGGLDYIDVAGSISKFGFDQKLIPDFKGLRGDPSDGIPGVYGVGEKTATKLIQDYGTLENIYHSIQSVTPESLRTKLIECTETALMSKKLATIIIDVPITLELSECKYNLFNKSRVQEILEKYHFKSLLKRMGFEGYESSNSKNKKNEPVDNQLSLL